MHYRIKIDNIYNYCCIFIHWSAMQSGGLRHLRAMGLSAQCLTFWYSEVLGVDGPWLNHIGRPQ